MTIFTKIYRLAWLILIFLLIFLDRQNIYWVITTIVILIAVSGVAVLRALESLKQWRIYNQEDELDEEIAE